MDKCIICGEESVEWLDSIDANDCGCHEDGIVHEFVCKNCGSEYCIYVPDKNNDDE